ncbi:acyl-CoA dehydrogenase [Jiulongibacter sp. NS-SX5]|uniref:acyl-CoA dehydrogenase n=1 Tax=Jiulongibacter sp. NS-SX5 TaxID=3463854 RepID=UPI004059A425
MSLYNRAHIDFILNEVLQVQNLYEHRYYSDHDDSTQPMILDMAEALSKKYLTPHFKDTDKQPTNFHKGYWMTHPSIKEFILAYTKSGLAAGELTYDFNGLQVPKTILAAADYILLTAHNSMLMYTDLIKGCVHLIASYGTDHQRLLIIPKMLKGLWLGTMCLTEPEAGSALAGIRTKAVKKENGEYLIYGDKIFISAGDHDLSENIIHLVLARIEGAPEGSKGISLFIVPKNKLEDSSVSNDVKTIGQFHKMGQKSTPAVHLSFGEQGNCQGYLLGEENKGLSQMFQMMNTSRLAVGMTGTAISSAAYHHSLTYAKERKQGKSLLTSLEVSIFKHPNIRRMLLTQKVIHYGALALNLQCSYYQDQIKSHEGEQKANSLLELLTPVAKTYGAEEGYRSVQLGLQILGGYGYTSDFPLEQLSRDARILSIYEGTTGIQSMTLLGRQLFQSELDTLYLFESEVKITLEKAHKIDVLLDFARKYGNTLDELLQITQKLFSHFKEGRTEDSLSNSTPYMEYFGLMAIGWQWLKMGIASNQTNHSNSTEMNHLLKFFFTYEFVKTKSLADVLRAKENLISENIDSEIF